MRCEHLSVADVDADNDNDDMTMQSPVSVADAVSSDVKTNDSLVTESNDPSLASTSEIKNEQHNDVSLNGCWKLAERNRGGFVVKDNLLYHRATILGLVIEPILVLNLVRARSSWLGIGTEPPADRSPIRRRIV